jgi:hypothetical protein
LGQYRINSLGALNVSQGCIRIINARIDCHTRHTGLVLGNGDSLGIRFDGTSLMLAPQRQEQRNCHHRNKQHQNLHRRQRRSAKASQALLTRGA